MERLRLALTFFTHYGIIQVMEDELLTKKEVAKMLKVSESMVYRLTRRGELPAIRAGRRFTRIRKSDVLRFLERHTE